MKKLYATNTAEDRHDLWELCENFILVNKISCSETIAQTDRVIENAYDFIEDICNLVGYVAGEYDYE